MNKPEWLQSIEATVENLQPYHDHQDELKALLSALNKAYEALDQYANTGNWQPWPHDKNYTQCCIDWKVAEQALSFNPQEVIK